METQNNYYEEKDGDLTSPGNFFRELEIEFLIHELKDPISIIETGMRSLLEKREKYGSLSPRQEKTLKRALRNTTKVREMLNGLLEIGRSEAGHFVSCHFRPAETLYAVLMDISEIMAGYISEHTISQREEKEVRKSLSDYGIFLDIAPQVVDIEIVQDETKFRQIFGNLIKNAFYHRKGRIDVKMDREGDYLCIEVTDDGPGVEPEHHQAIFQRYTQIEESSSPRKGHGLGLAGALILAKGLGGDIELDSTKGKGATFRLILPIILERKIEPS
jgi:two-component system OmpR family sensor kinase